MSQSPSTHPYSELPAFERLLLLIATLLQNPGIGSAAPALERSPDTPHHNAVEAVRLALQELACNQGLEINPSVSTLRKDLETLRRYQILEPHMYRWGYYLGTGILTANELQLALNALASMATHQGDPQAKQIYQQLQKRLRGSSLEQQNNIFYPVRQQLNRAIIYTDWEAMAENGESQDNLFHQWDTLVQAINQGQAVELSRTCDVYKRGNVGRLQVYPLQLVHYDVAWYLIYQSCHNSHLAIGRLNRFQNYCKCLEGKARLPQVQTQSLEQAHRLLKAGWGLYLGEPEEQQAELNSRLAKQTLKVRFFPPVTAFIQEGNCRHPTQKIKLYRDRDSGQIQYLDYSVQLPPRSIEEFSLWVSRYQEYAQVLSPPELVKKHAAKAQALAARYLGVRY